MQKFSSKNLLLYISLSIVIFAQRSDAQIITTEAGNGGVGYYGDGGPATLATLNDPNDVSVDAAGNVYIADLWNSVIRKVNTTGVISTLAGTGVGGYSGDGGQATLAQINVPVSLIVDKFGNIYIADQNNERVRKVSTSGIITTLAGNGNAGYSGDGGPATNAELSMPTGVAVDSKGNVYIAEFDNNAVRMVNASGIITTIAGNGIGGFSGDGGPATNAELQNPYGVGVDTSGNIYIGDMYNERIRKINPSGIITTIAGTGTYGYTGDGGPATLAELSHLEGVRADDSGNVYIADWQNNVLRKVNTKGIITTIAGDGNAGYWGDGGLATLAELDGPTGVAINAATGNIYIADWGNSRIREINSPCVLAENINPPAPSICLGQDITLKAVGSNGTSYNWSPAIALSATTGDSVVANPTTTVTYTVTIDSGNCHTTASAVLTVASPLSRPVFPKDTSFCGAFNLSLSAGSNGYKYQWSTGDTTNTIMVTGLGNYWVSVSNACNTVVSDTLSVVVKTDTALNIIPQAPVVCSGQSVTLNISGGGTAFVWSPATGLNTVTGDSVVCNPTATITYSVTGIDSVGCPASGSDVVTVSPSPNKPTITKSITGDTLISSARNGNEWYFDDTLIKGATDSIYVITGKPGGTYKVTVIDVANGCSTTSDSLVTSGIAQLSGLAGQVLIYPNPFNNNIFIKITSLTDDVKNWNLELADVLGRSIYTQSSLGYGNNVDLHSLPSGVYFITIITTSGRTVFPVVKQN